MKKTIWVLPACCVLALFVSAFAQRKAPLPLTPENIISAEAQRRAQIATDPQFGPRRNESKTPEEIQLENKQRKALNVERFQSLKKDTDKLLQLATELKESVDKSTKDTLSMEVIKKTEEVEKLAKQVREKMKSY